MKSLLWRRPRLVTPLLWRTQKRTNIVSIGQLQSTNTTLGDICDRAKPIVAVGPEATLGDVINTMRDRKSSTVFVRDGSMFIGFIKERHIIRYLNDVYGTYSDFLKVQATDIMKETIKYGSNSCTLSEALSLLDTSKQDHLPLVSAAYSQIDPLSADHLHASDIPLVLSSKQIIGQVFLDAVGMDSSKLDKDPADVEREIAEAAMAMSVPTVKQYTKQRKQEKIIHEGEDSPMVLNTRFSDKISVMDSVRRMCEFDKGSVVIMDVVHDVPMLKGIVTEQDIVRRALSKGLDLEKTPLGEIMSKNLTSVSLKNSLLSCAYRMIKFDVRHLPVVCSKGAQILDMISSKDLVSYFCEALNVQPTKPVSKE